MARREKEDLCVYLFKHAGQVGAHLPDQPLLPSGSPVTTGSLEVLSGSQSQCMPRSNDLWRHCTNHLLEPNNWG